MGSCMSRLAFQALQLTNVEEVTDNTVDSWRDKTTGRDMS